MSKIVIKPAIAQRYRDFMENGRVLFFSAPCGFGKSTLAKALLEGEKVCCLLVGEPNFAFPADTDWNILCIDNFQMMQEENEWQTLCKWIRNHPEKRFVLFALPNDSDSRRGGFGERWRWPCGLCHCGKQV